MKISLILHAYSRFRIQKQNHQGSIRWLESELSSRLLIQKQNHQGTIQTGVRIFSSCPHLLCCRWWLLWPWRWGGEWSSTVGRPWEAANFLCPILWTLLKLLRQLSTHKPLTVLDQHLMYSHPPKMKYDCLICYGRQWPWTGTKLEKFQWKWEFGCMKEKGEECTVHLFAFTMLLIAPKGDGAGRADEYSHHLSLTFHAAFTHTTVI